MNWKDLDQAAVMNRFEHIGRRIRTGELDLGRHHYALSLAQGVMQAIHCGYDRIFAVELGVAQGQGLLELCKAASFFRDECNIEIDVWGIDNASGLPQQLDCRDHPEIWHAGQFEMGDPDILRAKLPAYGHLLIGEVEDMVERLFKDTSGSRLCFVSIDLDYYSSTKKALDIFEKNAASYIPAIPVYVDDIDELITYNSWCGESRAIGEFNDAHEFRKIERKPSFSIYHFYVCHILDHDIRNGRVKPRLPFEIRPI